MFEQQRGKKLNVADAKGLTPLMLAANGESPEAAGYSLCADTQKIFLFRYKVARYASRNAVTVIGQGVVRS